MRVGGDGVGEVKLVYSGDACVRASCACWGEGVRWVHRLDGLSAHTFKREPRHGDLGCSSLLLLFIYFLNDE